MSKIFFFILTLSFLISCTSLKEANKVLKNEKIKTTDEFLVEKRDPLVFPPDFKKIPEPGTELTKKNEENNKIKKILKAPKIENTSNKKPSTVEDSILNRIRK